MYDACSRALDAAIAEIRPGFTAGRVHDACQRVIDAAGFEPLPPEGATDAEVEGWMERFIDASATRQEADHAR